MAKPRRKRQKLDDSSDCVDTENETDKCHDNQDKKKKERRRTHPVLEKLLSDSEEEKEEEKEIADKEKDSIIHISPKTQALPFKRGKDIEKPDSINQPSKNLKNGDTVSQEADQSEGKASEDNNTTQPGPEEEKPTPERSLRRNRKRRLQHSVNDSVMQIFEKAITICVDTDSEEDDTNQGQGDTREGDKKEVKSGMEGRIVVNKNDAMVQTTLCNTGSKKLTEFKKRESSENSQTMVQSDASITEGQTPNVSAVPVLQPQQVGQCYQTRVVHHDEAALAAARLMTDMAGNKTISQGLHSNRAETHVTPSGYAYSSGDHHDTHHHPGAQAMFGQNAWHPTAFGQSDSYGFHNVAMYDTNNNVINQNVQGYHQFPSVVPARSIASNDDDDDDAPPDFRNIHPYPMGTPLEYSIPRSHPEGVVFSGDPRETGKFVVIDPMKPSDPSPNKRSRRTKTNDTSPPEIVANYDEIVKNLFVPAQPKTVLVQPKFLAKYRGPGGNDIDPSKVKSISHRGLIRKYIDYLLMENEYITEISKAVSLPMDNCVMDDPYLMDVIRIKIPFPTPKYMQFLKDFYPSIQVDWPALNHQLDQYKSSGEAERFRSYYLDNRAVPVLLGEAFYFFQRESDRKSVEQPQK